MNYKGILCIALFLALITASAVSATPSKNSEMPTEDQFSTWISGFSGDANFVSSAYNGYIEEFPKCHVDKIESNGEIVGIVFYTSDPSEGAEGYASHYYDAKGDKMGIGCDGSFKLVDSYKGEGKSNSENENEVKEDKEEDDKEEVTEEEEHSYEDLVEALDDYEGKLSCSSKKCAKALSNYLEEDGWDTEIVKKVWKNVNDGKKTYGVLVTTEDEGDVYVILG